MLYWENQTVEEIRGLIKWREKNVKEFLKAMDDRDLYFLVDEFSGIMKRTTNFYSRDIASDYLSDRVVGPILQKAANSQISNAAGVFGILLQHFLYEHPMNIWWSKKDEAHGGYEFVPLLIERYTHPFYRLAMVEIRDQITAVSNGMACIIHFEIQQRVGSEWKSWIE